ncbi:hypothetical protein CDV31_016784 [Fusarium ambrosium]|uniref:Helicase C-terminal domain-containing protein n=1 Tax=Fusarium ambrosium TaxID=131363 RepID=A0A428S287_9HYPO|nr:hypothetical protein CDV31_016784 [Fusarium ambrosium]
MHSFESLLNRAEALFGGRRVVSFQGRIPGDPVDYDISHEEGYITFLTRYALRLAHDDSSTGTISLPALCAQLAPVDPELEASAVTQQSSTLGGVPAVHSIEADEIAEAHTLTQDAQQQDLLHQRQDEDDQCSPSHPSAPDEPEKDQEVIYISDDSLDDQCGSVNGRVMPAISSQDVDESNEDVDPGQGVLGHLRRLNSLPVEDIPEFARMFCLDPTSITLETEKRLPGTRLPLRLSQLAYLFRVITSARDHPDLRGHYLADDMASGKTRSTLARVVLTRTLQLMGDHIDNNPNLHCLPDTDEPCSRCPLGDAFGIQCLCEGDNPMRDFMANTARGVDIQVCPKGLQQNWVEQWRDYVQPIFKEPGHPLNGHVVLHGYTLGDVHRLVPIHPTSPPLLASELLLDVELESDSKHSIKIDTTRIPKTFDDLLSVASLTDQQRDAAYRHSSTSQEKGQMVCLLLTREKLSLDWSPTASRRALWSGLLKVYIKMRGSKPQAIEVTTCARLAPRSIAFDEYNLYQGSKGNIHLATVAMCQRRQPGGQSSPWVYFLSGTPASKSVTDFDTSYKVIQPSREQQTLFEDATRRLDRCRTRPSGDDQQAETRAAMLAVRDMISPWLTARGEGSPILDGMIKVLRGATTRFELEFETPKHFMEAYERLLRWAQDEIAKEPSFDVQKFQGTLKSLNLMLRGASVPEREGGQYESRVDEYTRDDGLFEALSDIIKSASHGIVKHKGDLKYQSTRGPLHALLFTAFPAVAAAAFHYVRKNCGDFAEAELVSAWHRPADREDLIRRLALRANEIRSSGQTKAIILITSFTVLSTGRNDLVFANIVLKLGEPWTNALTEQAIGRVNRPGQGQPTFFIDLSRKDNDAEVMIRARNRLRKELLGEKLSNNRLFTVINTTTSL